MNVRNPPEYACTQIRSWIEEAYSHLTQEDREAVINGLLTLQDEEGAKALADVIALLLVQPRIVENWLNCRH